MPQLNRDKESLYTPGRLNLWFLGTSAALVVAVLWLLVDDFRRPWKGVQRDFYKKQAALLAVKREVEAAKLTSFASGTGAGEAYEKDRAELLDVNRRLALAKQALDEPLGDGKTTRRQAIETLRVELAEQVLRNEEADRDIKAFKGTAAAVRNAYENATMAGDTKAKDARRFLAELNDVSSKLASRESEQSEVTVARAAIQKRIDEHLAPITALEKQRDRLTTSLAGVETQLGAARAMTESNQWRNLPMADIIAPTIKIEKVVVNQIHDDLVFATSPKVDMCMTCHIGIDKPLIDDAARRPSAGIGHLLKAWLRVTVGEKAWAKLDGDAATMQNIDRVTAPSNVRAWLTGASAKLDDLVPAETLKKAMGDDGYAKSIAGRDLLEAFRIEAVQWAHPHLDLIIGPTSPHPMASIGCTVCHAGVGRRLDFSRATHSPADEAQAKAWEAEHGWSESGKEYVDFPMIPARYVEGQCVKCHGSADPYLPAVEHLAAWDPATEKDGTILRGKRQPTDAKATWGFGEEETKAGQWGFERRRDASPRLDAVTGLPASSDDGRPLLVRRKAPTPRDVDPVEATGAWRAETLKRGVETVIEWGCTGCHVIKDFEQWPGFGDPAIVDGPARSDWSKPAPGAVTTAGNPKIGPDLTHIRDKTSKAWIARWIHVPNAYRPDTRMPSFYRWRKHADDSYASLLGPDGKPEDVPLVVDPTERDLLQIEVEVAALTEYLWAASGSRAATYPELPAGDPKKGAKDFYSVGCYGCHVGPGSWNLAKGAWEDGAVDDGARFRGVLPPGPRLTSIGSKYADAKMLAAWIDEPRHYNSVTRMPNLLAGLPELGPDNRTVVRSALQIRADLAAYLMAYKDPAFDGMKAAIEPAQMTAEHKKILDEFYVEWYGKKAADDPTRPLSTAEAAKLAGDLSVAKKLEDVGRKLIGYRGCYGCHNVKGFETEQPIGKDLSAEGSQDLHKFDFGVLDHHVVPHTRWDWIDTKLREPRIYDKDRHKPRWNDKLRMPKFNFLAKDREAVVAITLGLVKEPLQAGAFPQKTPFVTAIQRGRAVIERYGCNQCHTLEGKRGVLTAEQADRGLELWMLPPNLYGEGNRVHAAWLHDFLKHPYLRHKDGVRPAVIQRMPTYRLSDDEVGALVDYFTALAGKKDRLGTDPEDEALDDTPYKEPVTISLKEKDASGKDVVREIVVKSLRDEARALFDKAGCVKCHLPKGAPGTETGEGASAPPFTLSKARLQRSWMSDLLHNPQYQIQGTKMPAFWPGKSVRGKPAPRPDSMSVTYPQFLVGARALAKPTNDDIAEAQMSAIVRYLRHHYESPAAVPAAPEGK